ncbi:transposase [Rhodococcus erythropolis]|nr:transposase [Rhodococcus erythropolis]MCW2425158.1 transposase [Rhodococcus erythropolis]
MSSARNKRYPPELRERAVRMVAEVQHEYPSEWAGVESVADKLGIGTAQTLLNWIRRAQTDAGERPGVTTEMAAEARTPRAVQFQRSGSRGPCRGRRAPRPFRGG